MAVGADKNVIFLQENGTMKDLPPVRRIVCTVNDKGRSVIAADGETPSIRRGPVRPGFDLRNLWVTAETPARIDQPDRIADFPGFMPPPNGTVIKYIDFPP